VIQHVLPIGVHLRSSTGTRPGSRVGPFPRFFHNMLKGSGLDLRFSLSCRLSIGVMKTELVLPHRDLARERFV
jgi:hypothetical protein